MNSTQTITKISTQKQAGRYSIDLNGHFAFGVSESVLIQYGLSKGRQLSEELITEIKASEAVAKARKIALDYLAHQLRTEKMVRQRLTSKEVTDQVQTQIVQELKEQRYIDDAHYAKSYVRTQMNTADKGPTVIRQKLFQAGVSEENIQAALLLFDETTQLTQATAVANKAVKHYQRISDRQRRQKVQQQLFSKGYSTEIINQTMTQLETLDDPEQELENLKQQVDKVRHRYPTSDPQRAFKIKQVLYRKGYNSELIDKVLAELE